MTVKIGYYDIDDGQGVRAQQDLIRLIGEQDIKIRDPAKLAGSQVLFVENGNTAYTTEFTDATFHLYDMVEAGGVILFYDRAVSNAFFSGFTRDVVDGTHPDGVTQVNFVNDAGAGATGHGGTLTDTSLDNGNASNHGYADLDLFQDGDFAWLQTRDDPTRGITVLESWGDGYFIHSSMTLDYQIQFGSSAWGSYAQNMLEFSVDLQTANQLEFTNGGDKVAGTNKMDDMFLLNGKDKATGGKGDDLIHGGGGADNLFGNDGHDYLWGGLGADKLTGNAGNDQLWGQQGNDKLTGNDGADFINGGTGNDTLYGNAGQDTLYGGDGNDVLVGGDLSDSDDNDVIIGGAGADTMTGGAGTQTYIFGPGDANYATPWDVVTDFLHGTDKVNLTEYGVAITFSGTGGFHHTAGEVILQDSGGGSTYVYIDLDGDAVADQFFELQLYDGNQATSSDFII